MTQTEAVELEKRFRDSEVDVIPSETRLSWRSWPSNHLHRHHFSPQMDQCHLRPRLDDEKARAKVRSPRHPQRHWKLQNPIHNIVILCCMLIHQRSSRATKSSLLPRLSRFDPANIPSYTQNIWKGVGQGKLNIAVAGALSNVAVSIVKEAKYDLSMDYPKCLHYRGIVNHLVRNGKMISLEVLQLSTKLHTGHRWESKRRWSEES